jgi:hypothetical protein
MQFAIPLAQGIKQFLLLELTSDRIEYLISIHTV